MRRLTASAPFKTNSIISPNTSQTLPLRTPPFTAADNLSLNLKSTSSESKNSSRCSAIRTVIAYLSEIEAAAAQLQLKFVEDTGKAHGVDSAGFPLNPLLRDCYRLQANLSKVTLKAAPVTTMKESISQILSNLQVQLEAKKSEWVKEHEQLATSTYTTGMIIHLNLSHLII